MNRLWLRSSVLLLCLAQFFALSRVCRADDQAPAEKLLPPDTLFFLSISDVSEMKKKWDKSSIGQFLQDPQLKPFLEDVNKKIEEKSKEVEDEIGVSVKDLLDLPQGELTFAVMEKPARRLGVVMLLEYGDNQSTMDTLLKKMHEELDKDEAEHSTEDINGVTLHVYKLKMDDPENPFTTLTYFTDEEYLVMSTEVEAIKEVLQRWEGDSDETLASNEQFKYIMAQCKPESGEPQVKLFLSPVGMIQTGISMAQGALPQAGMAAGFLPLLGLDGLKGYGGTMSFDEGDFEGVANFFMYADNNRGLLGVFNFPAVQMAPPKWVPSNVASYAMMNWNVVGAYTSVETLIDSFQGRGSTARLLDKLADEWPNIHVKKDVLDHLDGKIQLLQGAPKDLDAETPQIPDFFVGLGLKDSAKMKKTLTAAIKSVGSEIQSREFNGETIYEFGNNPTFSIAVTEGQLVLTNNTPQLEQMMRSQTGRGEALADSPEYKRIAKSFPTNTSMMSFQRSDVQLKALYNLMKNSNSDVMEGIDFSKLPPFESVSKYFQPSGTYAVPDKKGLKTVSFSLKSND